MAKAPAAAATDQPAAKAGPSLVVQIGALLIVSAAAIGMGWLSGQKLGAGKTAEKETAAAAAHAPGPQEHGKAEEREEGIGAPVVETVVKLPDLTTNLAAPSDVWIRMELSLILNAPPQSPDLADVVHQDILAFVRTMKLHQLEGASGLMHFKADLDERAAIRSGGQVKRVLIRTLLFE